MLPSSRLLKRGRVRLAALVAIAACLLLCALTLRQTRRTELRLRHYAVPSSRDLFAVLISISLEKHVVDVRTLIRYWESERWPNGTLPCGSVRGPLDNATAHVRPRPDLIIYSAQPLSRQSRRGIQHELHRAPRSRQCFRRLRFVSAGLTDARNVYQMNHGDVVSAYNGPLVMFAALPGHPELRTRYRYAFLLEPDAVPVRGNFLAAVQELARDALAQQKMSVQSGCSANLSAPYSQWRNGQPALYRLGDEAAEYFQKCFASYGCGPWAGRCGYAWDAYLFVCTGGDKHRTAEAGVSCAFHHAGSVWQHGRRSKLWEGVQEMPFFGDVYLVHSAYVLRETADILEELGNLDAKT